MGINQVVDWFSEFKSSATSVEDARHSGCPSISKTNEN
jgi:hypothetical protein